MNKDKEIKRLKRGLILVCILAGIMVVVILFYLNGYYTLYNEIETYCLTDHLRVDGTRYTIDYNEIIYINEEGIVYFGPSEDWKLHYVEDGVLFYTTDDCLKEECVEDAIL